jgi:hypothetical protein
VHSNLLKPVVFGVCFGLTPHNIHEIVLSVWARSVIAFSSFRFSLSFTPLLFLVLSCVIGQTDKFKLYYEKHHKLFNDKCQAPLILDKQKKFSEDRHARCHACNELIWKKDTPLTQNTPVYDCTSPSCKFICHEKCAKVFSLALSLSFFRFVCGCLCVSVVFADA